MANYVILPLLFAAGTAALLSTADSALVPMIQSVAYDLMPKPKNDSKAKITVWMIGLFTLIGVMFLFFVVTKRLGYDFNSLLFTVFGIFIVSTPVILFGMFFPNFSRSPYGRYAAIVALVIGIVANLSASFSGAVMNHISTVQIAGPIGVVCSGVIMTVGVALFRSIGNQDVK
ncbi:MAG: hypothetical protein ACE5H1_06040 [Thermodesulfobacteriota bacterium]